MNFNKLLLVAFAAQAAISMVAFFALLFLLDAHKEEWIAEGIVFHMLLGLISSIMGTIFLRKSQIS